MTVETGKFLSLSGLQHYDSKIKAWVETKNYASIDSVNAINETLKDYATVTSNAAHGKTAYDALTVFMGDALATKAPTLPQISSALTTVTVNGKRLFTDEYGNASVELTAEDIKQGESTVADILTGLNDSKADKATTLAGYNISDAYTKDETNKAIADAVSGGVGAVKVTVTDADGTYIDVKGDVDETGLGITLSVDETGLSDKFDEIAGSLDEKALASDLTTLSGRVATTESNISTIQGWKINGEAITADTKLNAANLLMSDATDAAKISDEITSIKNAIQGGTRFIGVLETLEGVTPQAGDIFVASKDFDTFKADIEYIYDGEKWYELGNSSANAAAIAGLQTDKADKSDTYTKTEVDGIKTNLEASISTLEGKTVKSVTGGNSTYVTVTASEKDENGDVQLAVVDTIADNFLGKTAQAADSAKLNGQEASFYAEAEAVTNLDTAYKAADTELSGRIDTLNAKFDNYVSKTDFIEQEDIDALFV